jgi:hypothetical protein
VTPTATQKIVWIVGMGRSGSMWTFNTTRALVNSCGLVAMPSTVPANESDSQREARAAISDGDPRHLWVLKSHKRLPEGLAAGSRFIATRRDPRDILISQMRFADLDFAGALEAAAYYAKTADYYRRFPARIRLELSYPDIVGDPAGTCSTIASFLGLSPSQESVSTIVQTYSKQRVKHLIDRLGIKESSQSHATGDPKTVLRVDRNARLYDTSTGFQSGHVSDYRDGDWRQILSADQQARMNRALQRWLIANGYEAA